MKQNATIFSHLYNFCQNRTYIYIHSCPTCYALKFNTQCALLKSICCSFMFKCTLPQTPFRLLMSTFSFCGEYLIARCFTMPLCSWIVGAFSLYKCYTGWLFNCSSQMKKKCSLHGMMVTGGMGVTGATGMIQRCDCVML